MALTRPNGGLSCTPSVGLGMSGGYPGPGSFMVSARGTNLDEVIANGETPRDASELLEMADNGKLKIENLEIWKTDCPELALENNDLFVDAAGSSGGWGDPLDRDPALVIQDLNDGMTPHYNFVSEMNGVIAIQDENGVWQIDEAGTAKKRTELRKARLAESETAKSWWDAERQRITEKTFTPEVREMYAQSLSFEKFNREFSGFWQVEPGYTLEELAS